VLTLSCRYLKKHNVRDWLRVVASNKDRKCVAAPRKRSPGSASRLITDSRSRSSYELRYFNIADNGDNDDNE
jgi:hypothetical protein